jgi:hypothetical protein
MQHRRQSYSVMFPSAILKLCSVISHCSQWTVYYSEHENTLKEHHSRLFPWYRVHIISICEYFVLRQPVVVRGLLAVEASRSHSIRHTTMFRTPLDEWSVRRWDLYLTTQHSQETDFHAASRIRTCNPSKRSASDPCLRPRGHRNRQYVYVCVCVCAY